MLEGNVAELMKKQDKLFAENETLINERNF